MESIRGLLQLSPPTPHPLTRFSPGFFIVLQEILCQSFFCSDIWNYCKNYCIFKIKRFFLSTCCWSIFILLFCAYVFLRALFDGSAIIRLRTASSLQICIASYLASHQIMWYNKRNHDHGLKITNCCCFFVF